MASASIWDERYSVPGEYAYGTDPNDFLASVADRIPRGGKVLCLAEGEGRNAVFLAERGHLVSAVDSSRIGLDKCAKLAEERGVAASVETVCVDLTEFEPEGYDAVVAIFCHLPPPLREKVHRRCAAALNPGGAFILEAYTPRQVGRGTGGPPSAGPMMTADALRRDFAGTEDVEMEMEILRECDRDVREGRFHTGLGSVVQMVARKAGEGGGLAAAGELGESEGSTSPMPLLPITSPETIAMCKALPLRSGDVFVCSYPKSGTTWTQHIVLSLLMRHRMNTAAQGDGAASADEPLDYDHVSDYAPFYEVDQHWDAERRDMIGSIRRNHAKLGRRVFNTHLRWEMLPGATDSASTVESSGQTKAAKFIYLVRSPMDVCVSFYCHLSHQEEGGYDGSFDDFFREWIDGKIAFGSWADHVLSFAPAFAACDDGSSAAAGSRDVLLVSYEEMLADLGAVVNKMARFLEVDVSHEQVEDMLPTFTFAGMKSDPNRFQPRSVTWKGDFQFLRKGVSGDSLAVATDEQREALGGWLESERYEEKLRRVLESEPDALEKLLALVS